LVTVDVGQKATEDEIIGLLSIMEDIGKEKQPQEFKGTILKELPIDILNNKEYLVRYLLLVAILDQQAESPTARKAAKFIYDTYKRTLFDDPVQVMLNFEKLVPLDAKKIYVISPVTGRATTRFGWISFRVGGFLIYELNLNNQGILLHKELSKCQSPEEAVSFLYRSKLIEGLIRGKAVRMYVSWIGHPDMGIDISSGRWKRSEYYMPVNGHVGKVFSRTGILKVTNVETLKEGDARKDIIQATQLRDTIQEIVSSRGFDCIRVDHGAFHIGFNYCHENPVEAKCSICPLTSLCKRNMRWHAY